MRLAQFAHCVIQPVLVNRSTHKSYVVEIDCDNKGGRLVAHVAIHLAWGSAFERQKELGAGVSIAFTDFQVLNRLLDQRDGFTQSRRIKGKTSARRRK